MNVRCACCHRIERWEAGVTIVEQAGGARRPEDPAAMAREIVARSLGGAIGPVVGPCAGCGQPLIADDPSAPSRPYDLPSDAGRAPSAASPFLGVFQGALLVTMVVPILVWVFAVVVVVAFLSRADTLF